MIVRVAALLVLLAGAARAETRVELYTMGAGDDLFEAFGHGALCVTDATHPKGICYNYGTSDFSDPAGLIWRFLRSRAVFWVSRMPLPLMIEAYTAEDRTIYRQPLDLPPDQAELLAARLASDETPEHKYYKYNHYTDNCTTRLRDQLDAVTGGRLTGAADAPFGRTWRDVTLVGFSRDVRLLVGMEFLVGRQVDRPMTMWDAMFLPDVLRAEVNKRLGAEIQVVNMREAPLPQNDPLGGRTLVLEAAGALTLLLLLASLLGRGLFHFLLGVAGLALGLIGLVVCAAAIVALMPELRRNEVLVVCLPTDLLLIFLRGRALFGYLAARLVLIAAVVLGLLSGALVQPIWGPVALVAGPFLVAAVREAMWARTLLPSRPGGTF